MKFRFRGQLSKYFHGESRHPRQSHLKTTGNEYEVLRIRVRAKILFPQRQCLQIKIASENINDIILGLPVEQLNNVFNTTLFETDIHIFLNFQYRCV